MRRLDSRAVPGLHKAAGHQREALFLMGVVVDATAATFDGEVAADGVVIVDYWAAWCAPCRLVSPVLDELAESDDRLKVVKVDVDAESALATEAGVSGIPTLDIYVAGTHVDRIVGAVSRPTIVSRIDAALG